MKRSEVYIQPRVVGEEISLVDNPLTHARLIYDTSTGNPYALESLAWLSCIAREQSLDVLDSLPPTVVKNLISQECIHDEKGPLASRIAVRGLVAINMVRTEGPLDASGCATVLEEPFADIEILPLFFNVTDTEERKKAIRQIENSLKRRAA